MKERIMVTKSSMPDINDYINEISDLWETAWLTNMGEKHKKLESELKKYLKVEDISLFSNGHMALEIAIQAMNLKGEVITTPYTFVSTTHAIVRNNLTPVFCDINEDDYTIDVNKLEELITDKTCAIIPVHVYGNICNIEEIEKIASKYNLKVIYDAAHAFGVEYKNKGIGSYGDASMFSFHATKVFNTVEGGGICFKGKEFGYKMHQLKNFGIKNEEVIDQIGTNAKMNEFQAAMGLCNLKNIDGEIQKRKIIVEQYKQRLNGIDGIKICAEQNNVKHNYSYFPIVVDSDKFGANRDEIYEILKENNIFARKYFYPITNSLECFEGRYNVEETPVALKISKSVLTLPLYSDLSLDYVNEICNIILSLKK